MGAIMDTYSSYTTLTVSAWVYSASADPLSGSGMVVAKRYNTQATTAFRLQMASGVAFYQTSASGDPKALQAWGGAAGNWYHIYGTRNTSTVLVGLRDEDGNTGTDSDTSATGYTNGSGIRVTCGDTDNSNQTLATTTSFGEVAIWNVILSGEELTAVGKGVAPAQVRPMSLIAYYPHYGATTIETNLACGSAKESAYMQERYGGGFQADSFHVPASKWC
jgi:hypothetical protein